MKLTEVFKNTNYTYTRFSWDAVEHVENSIVLRDNKGKLTPYITCQIRQKEIKLTPEETVRQLYIFDLMHYYGYPASRIQLETPIHFGREIKRADVTIMDKDRPRHRC